MEVGFFLNTVNAILKSELHSVIPGNAEHRSPHDYEARMRR